MFILVFIVYLLTQIYIDDFIFVAEEKQLLDLGLINNSQNSVLELLRTQETKNEEDRDEKRSLLNIKMILIIKVMY